MPSARPVWPPCGTLKFQAPHDTHTGVAAFGEAPQASPLVKAISAGELEQKATTQQVKALAEEERKARIEADAERGDAGLALGVGARIGRVLRVAALELLARVDGGEMGQFLLARDFVGRALDDGGHAGSMAFNCAAFLRACSPLFDQQVAAAVLGYCQQARAAVNRLVRRRAGGERANQNSETLICGAAVSAGEGSPAPFS